MPACWGDGQQMPGVPSMPALSPPSNSRLRQMLSQVLNPRLANHIGSLCGLSGVLFPPVSQAVQSIPNIDRQINLNYAGLPRLAGPSATICTHAIVNIGTDAGDASSHPG